MTDAIICVDLQKDFVEGGSLAVAGGQVVADHLSRLVIPTFKDVYPGLPFIFTQDWHIDPGSHFSDNPDYVDSWPVHCVAESEGAKFAADFGEVTPENIFRKGQYRASYSGAEGVNIDGVDLISHLFDMGVQEVDIVGIAFDYCVAATAADLADAGIKSRIIHFFTASVHPENDEATIRELDKRGVEVYKTPLFGGTYA